MSGYLIKAGWMLWQIPVDAIERRPEGWPEYTIPEELMCFVFYW